MASVVVRAEPPAGLVALARHIAVIGLAGVTTGVLVGGIGSRVFMRIAGATGRDAAQGAGTEAGFTVGEITFGGSLALILFVGLGTGVLGAALYVVFRPWLGWAGRLRGVVFGVVLFAVGSATSDVMNPDNLDFFVLGNGLINVLVIVALFLTFGIVLEEVHRALDQRVPEDPGSNRYVFGALGIVGAVLAIPLLVTTMFTRSGCDCDPPVLVAWFTVLAAAGTVLWWASSRRSGLTVPAQIIGCLGLAGATAVGLIRAISDATEIIG